MFNYNFKEDANTKERFIEDFTNIYSNMINKKDYSQIVFLCVGTDRITGDAFGPIVGSKLIRLFEKDNFFNINIYGSLEENINYNNVEDYIKDVDKTLMIVIDSALSIKENIGKIFVTNNKTVLGKGLNKNRIEIGDISIKTVVAKDSKTIINNFKILQNVSLNTVIGLADIVSEGIYDVIKNRYNKNV